MRIYVPVLVSCWMANGRHQVGLVDSSRWVALGHALGLVLTVIEATAMLMLFTGVFERTWPKPFKGLSTVIGGMIPLWGRGSESGSGSSKHVDAER